MTTPTSFPSLPADAVFLPAGVSGLPAGAKSAEAAHEPRPRLRPGQVQSRCDR
jgi:hypothetical protein